MVITREAMIETINEMRMEGRSNEEIDDYFKEAMKQRLISLDSYFMVRDLIYKK